jgi:hypothetical protein
VPEPGRPDPTWLVRLNPIHSRSPRSYSLGHNTCMGTSDVCQSLLWIKSVRCFKCFGIWRDLMNWIPRNSRPRRLWNMPRSPSLYGVNMSRMFLPRSCGQCKRCKSIPLSLAGKHLLTNKIQWPRFMEVLLGYQIPRFGEHIYIPSLKDNRSLSAWSSFEKWRVLLNSNLLKIR